MLVEEPGAVAIMRKGEIDGIANLDPVITQLEVGGDMVTVADTRTEQGMKELYGGDYAASSVYATAQFIAKNPNTTQAVVNAMVRALRWLQKATPEQIVQTVPPEYYGNDKGLYKVALMKNLKGYSADGTVSAQAAQNVFKVLNSFEPTVQKAKIDLARTYDNSFALKAAQKYR
jgi:NitT/TauT family transport system substrate-binding protein